MQDTTFPNLLIPGFNADPSCVVDGTYYVVTSSFEYLPGLLRYLQRSADARHRTLDQRRHPPGLRVDLATGMFPEKTWSLWSGTGLIVPEAGTC
ncbi:hypothetical protein [Streptomyces sp. NPDC051016]|uniref:hypothetical protein n=1 Tax=Streptomyces sp. NPDC051016 TaxID=3365638 RepID=UPI00379382E6